MNTPRIRSGVLHSSEATRNKAASISPKCACEEMPRENRSPDRRSRDEVILDTRDDATLIRLQRDGSLLSKVRDGQFAERRRALGGMGQLIGSHDARRLISAFADRKHLGLQETEIEQLTTIRPGGEPTDTHGYQDGAFRYGYGSGGSGCRCCPIDIEPINIRILSRARHPQTGEIVTGAEFGLRLSAEAIGSGEPVQNCWISWFEMSNWHFSGSAAHRGVGRGNFFYTINHTFDGSGTMNGTPITPGSTFEEVDKLVAKLACGGTIESPRVDRPHVVEATVPTNWLHHADPATLRDADNFDATRWLFILIGLHPAIEDECSTVYLALSFEQHFQIRDGRVLSRSSNVANLSD